VAKVLKKYLVPKNETESEILPNLLNLSNKKDVEKKEFEGFYRAEITLTESLTNKTNFTKEYIKDIHKLALMDIYSFAGNYRKVNLSKNGFLFPAAQFIEKSMENLETNMLSKLKHNYRSKENLIKDCSGVHAELLFIHPFRDGNGRVARILANLMMYKAGYERLKFEKLKGKLWDEYINAVQSAGLNDYTKMNNIFKKIY
jgi:cell filamentation protein